MQSTSSIMIRLRQRLLSKSLSFRKIVIVPCIRTFATIHDEPEYQVETDPIFDPAKVHVPFLDDDSRESIYRKYLLNPNLKTLAELAKEYEASEDRIKAVVFLMENRMRTMAKHKINEVTDHQKEIYEKSLAPDANLEELASANNMSIDEIKDVVRRLADHNARMENVVAYQEYTSNALKEYSELGADVKFQETKSLTTKTLEDTYIPSLFGDDELEEQKKYLFKKIQEETKARLKPHPGLTFLTQKLGSDEVKDGHEVVDMSILSKVGKFTAGERVPEHIESRFKYAIVDLAVPDSLRKTIIRTRTGRFDSSFLIMFILF